MIVLVIVFSLFAVFPANGQSLSSSSTSDLVRLTVTNNSEEKAYLKLEGTPSYNFVIPGKTTQKYTPQRGVYTYYLTACGQTTQGKMDLTIYRDVIIPACGGHFSNSSNNHVVNLDPKFRPIPFTVENGNPKSVYVKLEGPKTYNFTVSGNTTAVYSTTYGTYKYTIYACETNVQGTIDLTKYQVLNIPVCGASASGSADEHQVYISFSHLVGVSIRNQTGADTAIALKGPKTYYFYVPAGQTKEYSLFRGSYSYSYPACKQTVKGKIEANNRTSLRMSCP